MLSVLRLSYWMFRRAVAYRQGSANKLFRVEEWRAPERETRNKKQKDEPTVKAIFTSDQAVFMSDSLGAKKQHPWQLLRALFVNLNIRGNIRSPATLSRGPRARGCRTPWQPCKP